VKDCNIDGEIFVSHSDDCDLGSGAKIFFSESPRRVPGSTQPPIHWLPGLKLPECEVDY